MGTGGRDLLLLFCFSCSSCLCFPTPDLIFSPSINFVPVQLFLTGSQAAVFTGLTSAVR